MYFLKCKAVNSVVTADKTESNSHTFALNTLQFEELKKTKPTDHLQWLQKRTQIRNCLEEKFIIWNGKTDLLFTAELESRVLSSKALTSVTSSILHRHRNVSDKTGAKAPLSCVDFAE